MNDRSLKEVEEVLGKPFIPDFSEYTRKIRNYVMIIGSISIVIISNNLKLAEETSLFGVKFEHMDINLIYQVLFGLEIYFLIHFFWLAIDNFIALRLRFSGTYKIYKGGFAYEGGADNEPDPSQTTLYFWWRREAYRLSNSRSDIEKITKNIEELSKSYADIEKQNIHEKFTELKKSIDTLNTTYSKTADILSSNRIPDSLLVFNNWFKYFHNIQGWRWIIIELLIPVVIGLVSITLLARKLGYC